MPTPTPSRPRPLISLAIVLAVIATLAACGATEEQTTTDVRAPRRTTVRPATTRPPLSKEALDEFERAIADSNTVPRGSTPSSSTSSSRPSSSSSTDHVSTTSALASTTTAASGGEPPPSAITAEDCKLYAQLVSFIGNLRDLVDPDPQVTAMRVADPVARSKAGLDQLQSIAPPAIKGAVDTLIAWARGLAAGSPVDSAAADAAYENLRSWYSANCE